MFGGGVEERSPAGDLLDSDLRKLYLTRLSLITEVNFFLACVLSDSVGFALGSLTSEACFLESQSQRVQQSFIPKEGVHRILCSPASLWECAGADIPTLALDFLQNSPSVAPQAQPAPSLHSWGLSLHTYTRSQISVHIFWTLTDIYGLVSYRDSLCKINYGPNIKHRLAIPR